VALKVYAVIEGKPGIEQPLKLALNIAVDFQLLVPLFKGYSLLGVRGTATAQLFLVSVKGKFSFCQD
jgi:hypothetical protein